jgi:hypothetical protein
VELELAGEEGDHQVLAQHAHETKQANIEAKLDRRERRLKMSPLLQRIIQEKPGLKKRRKTRR